MEYGGPDGELAASLRYLSQKFTMVTPQAKATLNDIGTEEWVHRCYQSSIIILIAAISQQEKHTNAIFIVKFSTPINVFHLNFKQ